MSLQEDLISMIIRAEEQPDYIRINYTVSNASDQDIYLTDVLITFENGKPKIDLKDINCSWYKPKGYLLISSVCEPLSEEVSLMTEPVYLVTKISAGTSYTNTITLKNPVLTNNMPSLFSKTMLAKGIRLEFGYSLYNESLQLSQVKDLGMSIFKASYSFLSTQKILCAEKEGLSILCKKR